MRRLLVALALVLLAGGAWGGDTAYIGGAGGSVGGSGTPSDKSVDVNKLKPLGAGGTNRGWCTDAVGNWSVCQSSSYLTGTGSPIGAATCSTPPCFYQQTDGNQQLWIYQDITGGNTAWHAADSVGKAVPPPLSFEDCNTTTGDATTCPDPGGLIVFDQMIWWANVPGGQRDANDSMYLTGTADATTDFIPTATIAGITATNTIWGRSAALDTSAATDQMFCRDNVTFAPCTTGATCVDSFSETGSDPEMVVVKRANGGDGNPRYYFASAYSFSGCNSGTQTLGFSNGVPYALTTSDTIQYALTSTAHYGPYAKLALAQALATMRWESDYYPKKNMLANGSCDSAATGWTVTSGAGDIANQTYTPTSGPQGNNAVYGKECMVGAGVARDAGSGINSDAINVIAGRTYTFHGYVMSKATAAPGVTIDVVNNSDHTTSLGATVWHDYGGTIGSPLSSNSTSAVDSNHLECFGWCKFFGQVTIPAGVTAAQLQIKVAGTGNFAIDHWFFYPSLWQGDGAATTTHYVFPNGAVSFALNGDSRSDPSLGSSSLPYALDTMFAISRPKLYLARRFQDSTLGTPGKKAQDDVTAGSPWVTSQRANYAINWFGLNDATDTRTAAQIEGDLVTIAHSAQAVGSVPVVITEYPYRGNDAATFCNSNTTNCATLINQFNNLFFTNKDAN